MRPIMPTRRTGGTHPLIGFMYIRAVTVAPKSVATCHAGEKPNMAPKAKAHPTEYFLAGGIAGVVSRTCIAPIERVKILYQIQRAGAAKTPASEGGSASAIARRIWTKEGIGAFWRGNSAAVVRVMPYMSLTFLTFEEYRAALLSAGVPKQAATLTAGSVRANSSYNPLALTALDPHRA